jgi:hypothetical protein
MVSLKLLNLLYKKLVIVFLVVVGVGGGGVETSTWLPTSDRFLLTHW